MNEPTRIYAYYSIVSLFSGHYSAVGASVVTTHGTSGDHSVILETIVTLAAVPAIVPTISCLLIAQRSTNVRDYIDSIGWLLSITVGSILPAEGIG